MTYLVTYDSVDGTGLGADLAADPDEFGRLLGPIMAGARARGVADAFEMMGLGAILIDDKGRVLHAGGRAERALLPLVRIVEGHLIGADASSNERLQEIVERGLGNRDAEPRDVEFRDAGGRRRFSMRLIPLPHDPVPATQLLRAVIVVTDYPA